MRAKMPAKAGHLGLQLRRGSATNTPARGRLARSRRAVPRCAPNWRRVKSTGPGAAGRERSGRAGRVCGPVRGQGGGLSRAENPMRSRGEQGAATAKAPQRFAQAACRPWALVSLPAPVLVSVLAPPVRQHAHAHASPGCHAHRAGPPLSARPPPPPAPALSQRVSPLPGPREPPACTQELEIKVSPSRGLSGRQAASDRR